jgi:hypothetical protein
MAIAFTQSNALQSNAVSDGIHAVRHVARTPRSGAWYYQEPIAELLRMLREIAEECNVSGWNGYNSHPINTRTIEMARFAGSMLPHWVPKPDITPESDGEISFSWYKGPEHQFSFSIGEKGNVSYAGVLGNEKIFGSATIGSSLPFAVIDTLQQLYGLSFSNLGI